VRWCVAAALRLSTDRSLATTPARSAPTASSAATMPAVPPSVAIEPVPPAPAIATVSPVSPVAPLVPLASIRLGSLAAARSSVRASVSRRAAAGIAVGRTLGWTSVAVFAARAAVVLRALRRRARGVGVAIRVVVLSVHSLAMRPGAAACAAAGRRSITPSL
jgi:hypothetical protein